MACSSGTAGVLPALLEKAGETPAVPTSPPRHGANDLDRVAVAHRGGGPSHAPHHGAVERDREAARLGNLKIRGLVAPEFSEIGRRVIARLSVDVTLHVDIPDCYA